MYGPFGLRTMLKLCFTLLLSALFLNGCCTNFIHVFVIIRPTTRSKQIDPCLYFNIFIALFGLKKNLHTHTFGAGIMTFFEKEKKSLSFRNHPKYDQSRLRYCFGIVHTC